METNWNLILEAIIAAIYLDAGLDPVRRFIEKHVLNAVEHIAGLGPVGLLNYKSLLQEKAQALGYHFPRYAIVGTSGPDHARSFTVEVRLSESLAARATGSSKKAASQRAAETLYQMLEDSQAPS
jgi:ribonuclease-3